MKLSRRGILAGLLATSTVPAAAIPTKHDPLKPDLPKSRYLKGQIMPRIAHRVRPQTPWLSNGPLEACAVIEYVIYDGKQWVPLESEVGERVLAALS